MATVSNGTSTVPVEIIAATLRRPLRREAIGPINTAAPRIQAGTPALLTGQISYLCNSLADALALDAIYAGLAPVTLNASTVEVARNLIPDPSWEVGGTVNGWAATGTRSLQIAAPAAAANGYVLLAGAVGGMTGKGVTFVAGQTYTLMARIRLAAAQTGALYTSARQFSVYTSAGAFHSDQAPNAAGEYDLRLTFTVPPTATSCYVLLWNGAATGGGDVWWDNAALVAGLYDGLYFDGDRSPTARLTPSWTGTVNASPSILTYTDLETGLTGLKHTAIGATQLVAERALPGRSSKWLYSIDLVEVP